MALSKFRTGVCLNFFDKSRSLFLEKRLRIEKSDEHCLSDKCKRAETSTEASLR